MSRLHLEQRLTKSMWVYLVGLASFATLIAVSGWALARYMYLSNPGIADKWAQKASGAYTTILNKYYVDELYDKVFVEPCKRLGEVWDWIDRNIIGRFINGIGNMTDVSAAGITWTEKHVMYAGLNVIGYGHHLGSMGLEKTPKRYGPSLCCRYYYWIIHSCAFGLSLVHRCYSTWSIIKVSNTERCKKNYKQAFLY